MTLKLQQWPYNSVITTMALQLQQRPYNSGLTTIALQWPCILFRKLGQIRVVF